MHLSYGANLKMKLYVHHSNVNIVYRRKSDNQDQVILDQGVLVTPLDPQLEGRLSVQGSELIMKKVHVADTGVFKVTDLSGYPVAHVYIEADGKRKYTVVRFYSTLLCDIAHFMEPFGLCNQTFCVKV